MFEWTCQVIPVSNIYIVCGPESQAPKLKVHQYLDIYYIVTEVKK